MAGKILPNTGKPGNPASLGGRAKGAAAGLFGAIFWVIVAAIFPYDVLTPYWPAAAQWAPFVLFAIAFLNLIKALFNLGQLARLAARAPSMRTTMRQIQSTTGPRAKQSHNPGTSNPRRSRAGLPPARSTPTVQRMR